MAVFPPPPFLDLTLPLMREWGHWSKGKSKCRQGGNANGLDKNGEPVLGWVCLPLKRLAWAYLEAGIHEEQLNKAQHNFRLRTHTTTPAYTQQSIVSLSGRRINPLQQMGLCLCTALHQSPPLHQKMGFRCTKTCFCSEDQPQQRRQ